MFNVTPQLQQLAQQISNEYGVIASPYVYQNDYRIYCALLIEVPQDSDIHQIISGIKSFLSKYGLGYTSQYQNFVIFTRQLFEKRH